MNATKPETPITVNAFATLLSELKEGAAQIEASQKLAELIQRVAETGKPGKLLLEIRVSQANRGLAANFSCNIQTRLPSLPLQETLLFVDTEQGLRLTRENPRQRNLNLTEVERPAVELKQAAS